MKYTLDNLKFPVVAIGTQIIDGEVSFENHTILFKSRNNFNKFLAETNEIFGEEEKDWFRVFYKDRMACEVVESFDIALILLLCIKTNNDRALGYVARMLGIET